MTVMSDLSLWIIMITVVFGIWPTLRSIALALRSIAFTLEKMVDK